MRAPVQEPIATSGQSLAKSQFERLNWGVVENAYHDLGTDLILMHRDLDRFDRGMLIGAQVKTSTSTDPGTKYFSEPVQDAAGELQGWWFRESTREHFDYWLANDLAHLIVLVDLGESKSYWAHICETAVIWTQKGAKVFVPRHQTVDEGNFDKLTSVAATSSRGPSWEGSAWTDSNSIPDQAKLRYALITPRLVAPHPNSSPDSVEPEQAVAVLVQCRFDVLDERRKLAELIPGSPPSPYLSPEDAKKSSDIIWQFYAALHSYICSGLLSSFPALLRRNSQPHIRAAIAAAYVSFLIEDGRPADGLACLDRLQRLRKKMSLVDSAWLDMQRARCLSELGQEDLARQISIALQALPTSARADPTARAVAASAAIQIFKTAPWFSGEVSSAIKRTDTAATWWRSQVIAWGLGDMLDGSFTIWTTYDELPLTLDSAVFFQLRTASLLSGFAGDHSGWRHSFAQLAKYCLQTTARTSDHKMIASFLSDLRQSGDHDDVWSATRRIVANGPVAAVEQASARVDLDASTVTTSLADIRLLTAAGDVLDGGRADAICKWALKTIRNPRPFVRRVRPSYDVEKYVLEMLAAVMPAGTKVVRRQVIQHVLRLPAVADTALATYYSTVLRSINAHDWTPKTLSDLALRKGDDRPLAAEIERVLAEHDLAVRQRLINRASRGSKQALVSLGDVRKLPRRVVRAQMEAAAKEDPG